MAGYFVGIDVGTTATKAVLMAGGAVLTRVRFPHRLDESAASGRVDPSSWWASVVDACRALNAERMPLDGIGLSVHSPVAIPMDADGEALCPGYRFETPGLLDIVRSISAQLSVQENRLIGNRISPATFIAAAYRLITETEPEVAQKTRTLGSVGTYIGQRLTGQLAMDPSQASYFGPFDTTNSWTWQSDLASRLGIPSAVLPQVLPSKGELGRLSQSAAGALGLPAGTRVIVGGGDTACAAYAAGVDKNDDRLITFGTTHVITDDADHPNPDALHLHLQRASVSEGRWLRHGVTNGGLALAVGARMLGYGNGGDAVTRIVTKAFSATPETISRAPIFIPHVRSERGPIWLEEPKGALVGLTADIDDVAAAWSIVEGVLFADRLVWQSFDHADSKKAILGGGFRGDDSFIQLTADLLAVDIKLSNESHLSAVGAAQLAAESDIRDFSLTPYSVMSPRPELSALVTQRWAQFVNVRAEYLIMADKMALLT